MTNATETTTTTTTETAAATTSPKAAKPAKTASKKNRVDGIAVRPAEAERVTKARKASAKPAAKKAAKPAAKKAKAAKPAAAKKASPKKAKAGGERKNRPVQYDQIAKMYKAGKSITDIAKATGRYTEQADPTASLRAVISNMITKGYKDAKGKVVTLDRRERASA